MLSFGYYEIFKNTFFEEHQRTTASKQFFEGEQTQNQSPIGFSKETNLKN